MLIYTIKVNCPLTDDCYADEYQKKVVAVCMSIGGNCKVCPYAVITKGWSSTKKVNNLKSSSENNKCQDC